MYFVASATLKRGDWVGLMERWEQRGQGSDPFANVILTPLPGLSERPTVRFVQEHLVGRSRIWFDSGGYFIQQGEITYEQLYQRLLAWYNENRWADVYVLPDYVPSSDLSASEVEERILATKSVARLFSREMPSELRAKALPVVQGYTREQIRSCVETYLDLGYQTFGFGSFDTGGAGKDINVVSKRALSNLTFLQELAAKYNFRTHAFGVGTPALIPTLYHLGVTSFDSSCWIRTAGYGNVLLPFLGRRNASHGMLREVGGEAYSAESFQAMKEVTKHDCPFCVSFHKLQRNRLDMALHNLIVIHDTITALERGLDTLEPSIRQLVADSRYQRMQGAS